MVVMCVNGLMENIEHNEGNQCEEDEDEKDRPEEREAGCHG